MVGCLLLNPTLEPWTEGAVHSSTPPSPSLKNQPFTYLPPSHTLLLLLLLLLFSPAAMKSIMERNPFESSFSFSRRYIRKKRPKVEETSDLNNEEDEEGILPLSSSSFNQPQSSSSLASPQLKISSPTPPIAQPQTALSRLRSALSLFSKSMFSSPSSSSRVTVTLFGHRRGHVHFAVQESIKAVPEFLIEMSTQTNKLVHEMASGLVRIALETDLKVEKKASPLLLEPLWRTYCNGRSCGYAMRKDCGVEEWGVLKVMESISMGAGVLPIGGDENGEGEIMYMRAKFERVAGSKHSMTFHMINPDRSGVPELSIYLLRV